MLNVLLGSSAVVFPCRKINCTYQATSLPNNRFIVAKTLLGLSSVFVSVPVANCKVI